MVLFSIFLSACDKPATTEAVKTTDAPKAEMTTSVAGADDFNKLLAWKKSQETALNEAQNDLQQGIANQDKAKIDSGFKAFQMKVESVLKSLDALEIKNEEVKAFKEKTKESLLLSNELIKNWVSASAQPTEENQKSVQEKAQKLIELGSQLQQTQLELQKKFVK